MAEAATGSGGFFADARARLQKRELNRFKTGVAADSFHS
jgi:hypothetical protein